MSISDLYESFNKLRHTPDQMSDSLKKRIAHRVTQKQKGLRYRVRPAP